MTKQELSELKKNYKHNHAGISILNGCYVNSESGIISTFSRKFACIPKEETFKYEDIFKKTLSGKIGKQMFNIPIDAEKGMTDLIAEVYKNGLNNQDAVYELYNGIINTVSIKGNYVIFLNETIYDVPLKTKDGIKNDDASDAIYRYIMCSICPVKQSPAGLSYNNTEKDFTDRIRDFVVAAPEIGFVYPAFTDRSSDLHNLIYHVKKDIHNEFLQDFFDYDIITPEFTNKAFIQALEKACEGTVDAQVSMNIFNNLASRVSHENSEADKEHNVEISINELEGILSNAGIGNTETGQIIEDLKSILGNSSVLYTENIMPLKKMEIKTSNSVVKVNPEQIHQVRTDSINGRNCLIIELDGNIEINGIVSK